jgi:hypothetical protein
MNRYINKKNLQTFWTNIKTRLLPNDNTLVNYVVEEGTTSNWTYRKWSNGFCEAWRQITNLSLTADGNNWCNTTQTIPSTFFSNGRIDCVHANATLNGRPTSGIGGCSWTSTSWTGHIKGGSSGSTYTACINLYAVGWWR